MSEKVIVGVGELGATKKPGGSVKTFALGSCVAVNLIDIVTGTVGMVHIALPDSSINPEKKEDLPGYFADSGIPALLQEMTKQSGNINHKKYLVKLAGGAETLEQASSFTIGKRNVLRIKKILWSMGMAPMAEEVEGKISRTVTVFQETGEVLITSHGLKDRTL